jgi:hypothetical protein
MDRRAEVMYKPRQGQFAGPCAHHRAPNSPRKR